MTREWKEERLCWKYHPQQSPRRSVLLYYSIVRLQVSLESLLIFPFFFDPLISFSLFSFIPPLLFISTFHLYARWLVLILVLSALPISPHVVAVRLKHFYINAVRELAAVHCKGNSFLPRYFGALPYLIFLQCLFDPTEFSRLSSLLSNHLPGPRPNLAEDVFILGTFSGAITTKPHLLFISAIYSTKTSPPRADLCS